MSSTPSQLSETKSRVEYRTSYTLEEIEKLSPVDHNTIAINELVKHAASTVQHIENFYPICEKADHMDCRWWWRETDDGNTALHLAILLRRFDLIKPLLELSTKLLDKHCRCFSSSIPNKRNETCLMTAILYLNEDEAAEVIKIIYSVPNKELTNIINNPGGIKFQSSLSAAIKSGKLKVLKLLLALENPSFDSSSHDPYHQAIESDCIEALPILFSANKQSVNSIRKDDTPLMLAVKYEKLAFVKTLLEFSETNVQKCNCFGQSALHIAMQLPKFNEEIVAELLNAGADSDRIDMCFKSPKHLAIEQGFEENLKKCLQDRQNRQTIGKVLDKSGDKKQNLEHKMKQEDYTISVCDILGKFNQYASLLKRSHLDLRMFAHIHNDHRLKGTSEEGNSFYNSITTADELLNLIMNGQGIFGERLKNHAEAIRFCSNKFSKLKKLSTDFENTLKKGIRNYGYPYLGDDWRKEKDGYLRELLKILTDQFSQDKYLFIPGGWQTRTGGHAMLWEFEEEAEGHLTVSVYNSGAGIEYHEKLTSNEKSKFSSCFRFSVHKGNKDKLSDLLYGILNARFSPYWEGFTPSAKEHYRFIHSQIILMKAEILSDKDHSGYTQRRSVYITGQRSGTCTWKVIEAWLGFTLADKFQLSHADYQKIKIEFKALTLMSFFASQHQFDGFSNRKIAHYVMDAIENMARLIHKTLPGDLETLSLEPWYLTKIQDLTLVLESLKSYIQKEETIRKNRENLQIETALSQVSVKVSNTDDSNKDDSNADPTKNLLLTNLLSSQNQPISLSSFLWLYGNGFYSRGHKLKSETEGCYSYDIQFVTSDPLKDMSHLLTMIENFKKNQSCELYIQRAIEGWALNIAISGPEASNYWRNLKSQDACISFMENIAQVQRKYLVSILSGMKIPFASHVVTLLSFLAIISKVALLFYPKRAQETLVSLYRPVKREIENVFIHSPLFYVHQGYLDVRLTELNLWFKSLEELSEPCLDATKMLETIMRANGVDTKSCYEFGKPFLDKELSRLEVCKTLATQPKVMNEEVALFYETLKRQAPILTDAVYEDYEFLLYMQSSFLDLQKFIVEKSYVKDYVSIDDEIGFKEASRYESKKYNPGLVGFYYEIGEKYYPPSECDSKTGLAKDMVKGLHPTKPDSYSMIERFKFKDRGFYINLAANAIQTIDSHEKLTCKRAEKLKVLHTRSVPDCMPTTTIDLLLSSLHHLSDVDYQTLLKTNLFKPGVFLTRLNKNVNLLSNCLRLIKEGFSYYTNGQELSFPIHHLIKISFIIKSYLPYVAEQVIKQDDYQGGLKEFDEICSRLDIFIKMNDPETRVLIDSQRRAAIALQQLFHFNQLQKIEAALQSDKKITREMICDYSRSRYFVNMQDATGEDPIEAVDPLLYECLNNIKFIITPPLHQFYSALSQQDLYAILKQTLPQSIFKILLDDVGSFKLQFPYVYCNNKESEEIIINIVDCVIQKLNFEYRRVPRWVQKHAMYKKLVGEQDLGNVFVEPDNLVEFHFKGTTYRVSKLGESGSFYRKFNWRSNEVWYQYIANLDDKFDCLPSYCHDQNYTLWIDLKKGKDKDGKENDNRSILIADAKTGENCYFVTDGKMFKLEKEGPIEVLTVYSYYNSDVVQLPNCLEKFESHAFIEILRQLPEHPGKEQTEHLSIHLPRYNVSFSLQNVRGTGNCLVFNRDSNYQLNLNPIKDLIPGFQSYLQLDPIHGQGTGDQRKHQPYGVHAGKQETHQQTLKSYILIPIQPFVYAGNKLIELDRQGIYEGDLLMLASGDPKSDDSKYRKLFLDPKDWNFREQSHYFKIAIKRKSKKQHIKLTSLEDTDSMCHLEPQTSEEALYLSYIALATHNPEMAFEYFEHYRDLGGLSGSPLEAKLIQWILKEIPYQPKSQVVIARFENQYKGRNQDNILETPEITAFRAALLVDVLKFLSAQMHFNTKGNKHSTQSALDTYLIDGLKLFYDNFNLKFGLTLPILIEYQNIKNNIPICYQLQNEDFNFLANFTEVNFSNKDKHHQYFSREELPVQLPKIRGSSSISSISSRIAVAISWNYTKMSDLSAATETSSLINSFQAYIKVIRRDKDADWEKVAPNREADIEYLKNWTLSQIRSELTAQTLNFSDKMDNLIDRALGITLSETNCKSTLLTILFYILEYPARYSDVKLAERMGYDAYFNLEGFIKRTQEIMNEKPLFVSVMGSKTEKMDQHKPIQSIDTESSRSLALSEIRYIPEPKLEIPTVKSSLQAILRGLNIDHGFVTSSTTIAGDKKESLDKKRETEELNLSSKQDLNLSGSESLFPEIDLKDYLEGRRQNQQDRQLKSQMMILLTNKRVIQKLKESSDDIMTRHGPKLLDLKVKIETLMHGVPKSEVSDLFHRLKLLGKQKLRFSLKDILKHYLRASKTSSLYLNSEHHMKIQEEILTCLVHYYLALTSLQQYQRILEAIRGIEQGDENYAKLIDCLMAERSYSYQDLPYCLPFEASENILIREGQKQILQLTSQKARDGKGYANCLFQMMMGQGKTTVIAPISDYQMMHDTQDNLVFQLVPKAISKTQRRELNMTSRHAFYQSALPFQFARGQSEEARNLKQLFNYFQYCIATKEYQVTTQTDIPALQLKWIEMLSRKEIDEQAILIMEDILELIQEKVDAFIDECDTLFDVRKELNYTLGEFRRMRFETLSDILNIYSFFDKITFICRNKIYTLNEVYRSREFPDLSLTEWNDLYDTVIVEKLSHVLVTDPKSCLKSIVDKLMAADQEGAKKYGEELKLYISGKYNQGLQNEKEKKKPEFIKLLTQNEKHSIALCKQELKNLLRTTLRKKPGKNYGKPRKNDVQNNPLIDAEVACPYFANKKPSKNSQFYSPYQTLNYTIQLNKIYGISLNIFKEFIQRLLLLANNEKEFSAGQISSVDDTEAGRVFRNLVGQSISISSINVNDSKMVHELYLMLRKKPEVIDFCLIHHILTRVRFNSRVLRHNALNHSSMYRSVRFGSGTILSLFIFDERLEFDARTALGVDGRTIDHLLHHRTPVGLGNSSSPFKSLESCLVKNPKLRALIDVGAYFYGISNHEVSKWLAKFYARREQSSSGIKYILFFNEHDALRALKVGSTLDKPLALFSSNKAVISKMLNCNPHECFTYFDELRSTGTNIAQMTDAHAVITLGSQTMMKDFLQGAMRMRELAESQRLQVLVPRNMEDGRDWDINKVLSISKKIQIERAEQDNYRAALFKIRDVIRSDLLRLLRQEKNFVKKLAIFRAMEPILFTSFDDSPWDLFGDDEIELFTKDVLLQEKNSALEFWRSIKKMHEPKIHAEAENRMTQKLDAILIKAETACPKRVTLSNETEDTSVETIADVNTQMQALLNVNQAAQQELERDSSFLNDLNPYASALTEVNWPDNINLAEFNLFEVKNGLSLAQPYLAQPSMPQLLALNPVMKHWDTKACLSFTFSSEIFVTSNYLRTLNSQPDSLIHSSIKPLHYAMFIQDNKLKTLRMIIMTQAESFQFEKLFELPHQTENLSKAQMNFWIITTNELPFAGLPPKEFHPNYQTLMEQLWYIAGETQLFAKHSEKLKWLREDLTLKLSDYNKIILSLRPDKDKSFPYLRKLLLNPGPSSRTQQRLGLEPGPVISSGAALRPQLGLGLEPGPVTSTAGAAFVYHYEQQRSAHDGYGIAVEPSLSLIPHSKPESNNL